MKPFVILALPRSGTKMLVSALASHPDMPAVTHEFRGGLRDFLKHPYVLSNEIKWWMRWPIKVMHLGRVDSVAGALSLIKMSYNFPDMSFDIPPDEVAKLATYRRDTERQMRRRSQWWIAYEDLTSNQDVRAIMSDELCDFFGVERRPLTVMTDKRAPMRARNEAEICADLKTLYPA